MPATETPPPQPPRIEGTPSPRARRGRVARGGDYDGLGSYDLVHIIDELEDERARISLREKIWIALILHLLIFLSILFAPKYIWHVKVRDTSPPQEKQMTYLDLPPELVKKPKAPAHISDQDRRQQTPTPQPQRKDLEAMRRAGPPAPTPAPAPQRQPAPAPPQVAQQPPAAPRPQPPVPQPRVSTAAPAVDAPRPQPTKPNFSTGPQTPADAVQQAARQAERGGGATYGGGDAGSNAPSQHPGDKGAVDILSDTLGVDFGPYIQRVIYDTKRAWYPIIPEVAQPPINKQGKVLIRFKILPDGSVKEMHLEGPSGDVSLDRAAWGGITGGGYPPLPKNFKGPFLELRFYFLYNDNAGIR